MLPSPSTSMTSLPGIGELRADRRRQAEAHRAHAARGEERARVREVEVLRRPHLVLADAGRDDRLAARDLVQLLEHVLGLDRGRLAVVVERVPALQLRARARASGAKLFLKPGAGLQRAAAGRACASATCAQSTFFTLPISEASMSRCAILALRRELLHLAGDAVVEARADREQEVAVLDRVVGVRRAVHAEHAAATARWWCRSRRCPCSVVTTGMPKRSREGAQLGRRVAVDDAAAGVDAAAAPTRRAA